MVKDRVALKGPSGQRNQKESLRPRAEWCRATCILQRVAFPGLSMRVWAVRGNLRSPDERSLRKRDDCSSS